MKEKALYIIIGVLIAVVIMQWHEGPPPVQAQAEGTNIIAVREDRIYLDENGGIWQIGGPPPNDNPGWVYSGSIALPVPADEVKIWSASIIVTTDNHALYNAGTHWIDYGPCPGSAPVPTEGTSLGDLKARYGDGKK
jgi:hypothetical protein